MSRVYFHIDLNAFFASCEELLDPSLKGKPLVVGGKSRRSVISTANYEARKYGIHSAMPMQQAEKLCKDLVIVNGHYAFYSDMSHQFMQIIHSYTDLVEKASIDECYADMTDVICRYPKPLDVAFEIQRRVLEETGLRCSIGIGPNMFLAKMASDMKNQWELLFCVFVMFRKNVAFANQGNAGNWQKNSSINGRSKYSYN